ncbi:tRNA lysidine(34) synthetase TilS [Barrientosiimonas marina]|uniref:tRNA(Ile)-lysidine synthase n=1 Tax=Lentibacillus kimchii TaxID=1542911 RepID=A0ABW2UVH9_9BACI
MDNTVRAFIRHHQMVRSHTTVLLAVSGGPDSMALLHFFYNMQTIWDLRLIVVSIDHGLRGQESLDDLNFVRQTCQEWGIAFVGTSLDVGAYQAEKQIGTQKAARDMRYQFFAEQMNLYQADYLAFGHHADDQLETMLMGLIHSASVKSLAGIPLERAFASGKIIRPLLGVTKDQIEHYCRQHALRPRRDPSNAKDTYTRNDYRHNILPLLKAKNHSWHRTIRHMSASLQEDDLFLQQEARKMVHNVVNFDGPGLCARFNIYIFKSYSRPLQRRALHLILDYLYKDNKDSISYSHEEQFFAMLMDDHGHSRLDFPQSLKLVRSYASITFYFQNTPAQPYHKVMNIPGETEIPGGTRFSAVITAQTVADGHMVYLCPEQGVAWPLHIRTRRSGDRMRWSGLNGSKKLKDIFIDAKIPVNERDMWPVITDNNDNVLWLPGLKKGLPPIQAEKGSCIQISYTKRGT